LQINSELALVRSGAWQKKPMLVGSNQDRPARKCWEAWPKLKKELKKRGYEAMSISGPAAARRVA